MCYAIYSGHEARLFPPAPSDVSHETGVGKRQLLRVRRRLILVSSVIQQMRREIEAQLVVSMLLLDTAAISRRAVNH